jgi:hypothetical protein
LAYIGAVPTSATFAIDTFNGDGSTVTFTLREAPLATSSILVFVGGVRQNTDTYSLSGASLIFSEAPPSGTGNIQVLFLGLNASPSIPSDGSVTANKIVDGVITGAKLAASSITGDKIGLTAINANNIVDTTITGAKIASATITGNKIATNQITGNLLTTNCVTGNNIAVGQITGNLLTANCVTAGNNITGTLAAFNGGTGLTAPGTTGNVLTSNGSAWVSSAPAGGSPWTKIATVNGSSMSPYGVFSGLSGYNAYYMVVSGLQTASGLADTLYVQFGHSGGTYITSSVAYSDTNSNQGNLAAAFSNTFSYIPIGVGRQISSSSSGNMTAEILFTGMIGGYPSFTCNYGFRDGYSATGVTGQVAGYLANANSITNLRVFFGQGNGASGTITLYGLTT